MTLCLAAANAGRLPSIEDMANKFRLSEAKAQKQIDDLRGAGFIDEDESGLSPHNWASRQFKSDGAAERMKRHRQRNRDVTGGVTMTVPDTDKKSKKNKPVTSLIEVTDEDALAMRRVRL
jgi:hypothetical protein